MLDLILESGKTCHDFLAFGGLRFIGVGDAGAVDVIQGPSLGQSVRLCDRGEGSTDDNLGPAISNRDVVERDLV